MIMMSSVGKKFHILEQVYKRAPVQFPRVTDLTKMTL